ncbi:ECF-type sigma factor [Ideonella sp.]|uniref:ECF-type sigma factor n=1 Tax=Ideonella sp. TaxID=1929293 RepID=UPI002B464052|nr:ECF-type sigma factor [Ideonella sp.]HJV72279.1 ECF-type sigma factor [Ideonella sp.]
MPSTTQLLQRSAQGDGGALRELYAQLYPEIKRVARARLAQQGGVPSLDTTALVHEGFLRIAQQQGIEGAARGQFFAYVGKVLRSVVIDHVRNEGRDKRGGDMVMVTMSAAQDQPAAVSAPADLVAIDQALTRMRDIDPALYELVEMQAFAGVSADEVAALRGVSSRTVNRELAKARGLLQALLGEAG